MAREIMLTQAEKNLRIRCSTQHLNVDVQEMQTSMQFDWSFKGVNYSASHISFTIHTFCFVTGQMQA
jgi:hypothetical protein